MCLLIAILAVCKQIGSRAGEDGAHHRPQSVDELLALRLQEFSLECLEDKGSLGSDLCDQVDEAMRANRGS